MLTTKNFLILTASLSLTSALPAANLGGTGAPSTARINLNSEIISMRSSLVILQNELMNNQEEEFIILGPDSGYFLGFNEGMTDAIGQINDFDFTGDMATDIAAIGSNLAAEEADADALGTSYGTGLGTAYRYAQMVITRRGGVIVASAANPVAKTLSSPPRAAQAGARPLTQVSRSGNQR